MSIQITTIPLCLIFLFTMEGAETRIIMSWIIFFTKDTEWAECLWEWRGHRFHRLNVDKASWPNCTLKIQGSIPGPTIAKGLGMGTQKWEEKRPSSSLKTTLLRKSKCFKALQNLDFFSFRGTYSEYSYSIAVSMLEYVLQDDFDSLLSRYVFEPLDMVG